MADVSHNLSTAERNELGDEVARSREVPWRFTPLEGGSVASIVEGPAGLRERSVAVVSPGWRRKATGGIRRIASLAADAHPLMCAEPPADGLPPVRWTMTSTRAAHLAVAELPQLQTPPDGSENAANARPTTGGVRSTSPWTPAGGSVSKSVRC